MSLIGHTAQKEQKANLEIEVVALIAEVRMEGTPVKNHSFWSKGKRIETRYIAACLP